MTKLNCTTAVSPRTSTLHSSTISVYISVFSLPPSTCLRLSLSLFVVLLLLPSSLFFFIHFSELNPTFLTHPFCTLANPKLCPLHLCSISGFIAEHWDTLYMPIQFCTEIWGILYTVTAILCNWQVTEPMSVLNSESEQGTLFSFLVCACVCCVSACGNLCVCSLSSPLSGGGVPRPFRRRVHVCAGLMSINLCPASFLLQSTAVQVRGPGGRKKETSVDTHDQ